PCTTVGDRAALRVGEGEAPSVAGAGGEGVGQIAGVTRVERSVAARVAGRVGQSEPRRQRHREIHGAVETGGLVDGAAQTGGLINGAVETGGLVDGAAQTGEL